jgi:molybdate transport system substrate-binding protein
MRRRAALVALALLALLAAGCGGGSGSGKPTLTVFGAASLKKAFGTDYAAHFSAATLRFSFAGSDQLAAQIRSGVHPDVFASANTDLPAALYASHLVEKPVNFARNRLVLAVPASGAKVGSLADAAKPGVTLAVGAAAVPVGKYTTKVLAKLPAGEQKAIQANVRTREPDVSGVVGKLASGAVDAGFVYTTDVKAANGRIRAIALPASLDPIGTYAVAVVRGTKHPAQAQAFVAGLLHGAGEQALRRAAFLPPP